MLRYVFELSGFDVLYEFQIIIKGYIIEDFIIENISSILKDGF